VKEALDLIGLDGGPARRPVGALTEEARSELIEVLKAVGLL
jgi:dihydrodipicolinate synthase/N-acetylneuraminate lyase